MKTYPKDIELGGKWEDIPCVTVSKILEKRDWFNGTVKFQGNMTEEQWNQYSLEERVRLQPTEVSIHIPFKQKMDITFWVTWTSDRKGIQFFRIAITQRIRKQTKSKTCEKAVEVIEDMLVDILPDLEREIAEREAKEKEEQQYIEIMTTLAKNIDISLTPQKTYINEKRTWFYKNSNTFSMYVALRNRIPPKEGGEPLYVIETINGYFTQEDIKRFIEVLATSRTAVAARLTGE